MSENEQLLNSKCSRNVGSPLSLHFMNSFHSFLRKSRGFPLLVALGKTFTINCHPPRPLL